jgi:chitodextrinase
VLVLGVFALLPALAQAHPGHAGEHLEGTLQIVHSDDFGEREATYDYHLLAAGGRLSLEGPEERLTELAGERVAVTGIRTGDTISVESIEPVAETSGAVAGLSDGARETAVLLVNFASSPAEPFTPEHARHVVFTGPDSVDAYYREQSFGGVALTGRLRADGDVFGWLTIDSPTAGCPYRTWSAAARAAAQAAGADLAGYDHVVYAFPYVSACGWGGLGELPGDESWVNGLLTLRVVGHELGHNLGVHHANSLRCLDGAGQGLTLAEGESCAQTEYGDPFSIMGNSSSRHLSAWHKAHLGWIGGTGIHAVAATGNYTVWPLGYLTPGAQLLKIGRGDGSFIYVDFRRPYRSWFETFPAGSAAVTGVTVRLAPEIGSYVQSALVDAKPKTHSLEDAPLLAGEQLTDPVSGVTISVAAVTPWNATVRVTLPGPIAPTPPRAAGDRAAPTAAGGLAATPGGGAVVLSWSPSTDDVGVAGYWLLRDGIVVGAPLGTAFVDDTAAPSRTYTYSVRAYDAAGNVGAETAGLAVTTPTGLADTTAPTVPGRFRVSLGGTTAYLVWDPSYDAGGLSAYVLERDGVELGTSAGTLYVDAGLEPGRSYVYRLRARDRAGNLSGFATATVTVPASATPPPPGLPPQPPPPTGPGGASRSGPGLLAAPRLSGRAQVGGRLVVRPGRWSGPRVTRSWRWLRCRPPAGACAVIAGARGPAYRPRRLDVGFTLRAVETARNAYGRATAASRASVRVKGR